MYRRGFLRPVLLKAGKIGLFDNPLNHKTGTNSATL
jgi:hypothetical protein